MKKKIFLLKRNSSLKKFPKKIFRQKKFPSKKKKYLLKKIILVQNFEGRRKKMRLIVKIAMSKNQNQMKKTVETQTQCETYGESDIEFVRITPLHPRECLKRKVAKINYS